MSSRIIRGSALLGLLMLSGCLYPVNQKIDATICDLASRPLDLQPLHFTADQGSSQQAEEEKSDKEKRDKEKPDKDPDDKVKPTRYQPKSGAPKGGGKGFEREDTDKGAARPKSKDSEEKEEDTPGRKSASREQLNIPDALMPGGRVPSIPITGTGATRRRAIDRFYTELPDMGEDHPFPPGPKGLPLTLADLQKLAAANSPLLKQAAARVEEARGNAVQVGLPPNPTMGLEVDTYGTTGGAGYIGGFVDQVIKTANKLQLARASATADLRNAEFDLFKARTDLASRIRGFYFAVLVAEESIRLNRALVTFTTSIYQLNVLQLRRGYAVPYEPAYLRSLAVQARAALIQARNRRTAAWKQLAAAMGLAGMPATKLAGRIDVPVPVFEHRTVLAKVLSKHSSFGSAATSVQKAKFDLELAVRTPIPDVEIRAMLQKDRTGAPYEIAGSLSVSVPVPVWNRNQGGILQAQAALIRTQEEAHRVRGDLSNTLADAFERYENARVLLEYYRDLVLPDLVRAYRGTYIRWRQAPDVPTPGISGAPGISDIVVAQQNLAGVVATYITTLGQLWQAVVDVADLLQTPDLFGVEGPRHAVAEIPDLQKLVGLPCCHPCSPLPNLHHTILDADWPPAAPPKSSTSTSDTTSQPQKLPAPTPENSDNKDDKRKKSDDDDRMETSTPLRKLPPPAPDRLLLEPPPPMPAHR